MIKRALGRLNLSLTIIKGVKNWIPVFANYFKLSKKTYMLLKFRDGNKIKLRKPKDSGDTSGIATIFEIFLMKTYNPLGMEINISDTVVDIGANIGIFSLYAAQKTRKGIVYSYEPFPAHYKRLQDNIRLNNLKNIKAFNLGISDKKQKKDLFINEHSSGMHSTVFTRDSKSKIPINCTALKDIFKENKIKKCDFFKIDCEGAEYEILFNLPKNIFKKIKLISLEFDNIDEKRNCFELKKFLEKNNFEVFIKNPYKHQGILYARNVNLL